MHVYLAYALNHWIDLSIYLSYMKNSFSGKNTREHWSCTKAEDTFWNPAFSIRIIPFHK